MAIDEQQYVQEDPLLVTANRVRELEGKYNLLRDRVLIINNNMIEEYKKIIAEMRVINDDIREIKSDIFNIKETIKHVVKEFDLFARKDDVKYLEKYINFWNPMKFVTEDDVRRILEEQRKPKEEEKREHAKRR